MTDNGQGVSLEAYAPSKKDQRRQNDAERTSRWVREQLAKLDEQLDTDPVFREAHYANVRKALDILRIPTPPVPDHEIRRWRVKLFCGDIIEITTAYTDEDPVASRATVSSCPICHQDPIVIVACEALGRKADPPEPQSISSLRVPRPTRAQLEAQVAALRAEVAALKSIRSGEDIEGEPT
ncbi:hypothetical protein [Nocardia sp. NPDC003183]